MTDPTPDGLGCLFGEDKENSKDEFTQMHHNPKDFKHPTESKQKQYAESLVLDNNVTLQQTSVSYTSQDQTPKTEVNADHCPKTDTYRWCMAFKPKPPIQMDIQ